MKTMKIRDFLRGGYKDITEMTVITHHGAPLATWMPQKALEPREYGINYSLTTGAQITIPKKESR